MAILKGFPPSNTISCRTYIFDAEEDSISAYWYSSTVENNPWIDRTKDAKSYRQDIEFMLRRLDEKGMGISLGENLMDHMVRFSFKIAAAFHQIERRKGGGGGYGQAPWFVWFEYHVAHELSRRMGVDVRSAWMKSWDWQKTDGWCQKRMKESLEAETPLEYDLKLLTPQFDRKRIKDK